MNETSTKGCKHIWGGAEKISAVSYGDDLFTNSEHNKPKIPSSASSPPSNHQEFPKLELATLPTKHFILYGQL